MIYQQKLEEDLKKQFANTYKFCNHDIHKFILPLQKDVYLYECMNDWEKFIGKSFPEKEYFYSNLNMEDTTGADYKHAKRIWHKNPR